MSVPRGGSVKCPKCERTVEWTPEEWNGPANTCTSCTPRPVSVRDVQQQKAIPVVLTGIDVSIGDLAVLLLKLLIAGIPVGIVLWGLVMILRVLLLLRS
jgi:hypothetical protein